MMEVRIKVQSLSDVITNSSSEIMTTITGDAVDVIKEMVDELLRVGGSRYCFDNLFTIETFWDREDEWEDMGYDSKEDYIHELEDSGGELEGRSSGMSYSVKAKDPNNEEAARLLNKLQGITDSFEYYC